MDPSAYVEMSRTEAGHWWFAARRDILDMILGTLHLGHSARLLEVGSGTGGNLAMLSSHGSVSAMEMDDSAIAISKEKTHGKFRIIKGSCPDNVPFSGEQFDVICMFDVLEHVADDVTTLRRLRDRAAPRGTLVIAVPAYQWLWTKHDVHLHHFRRYCARSLRRVVASGGWRVERISYFNTLLFPLAVIARECDKLSHTVLSSGASTPPKWLNVLAYRIFRCERRWLVKHSFLFGVSLLCVARKVVDVSEACQSDVHNVPT